MGVKTTTTSDKSITEARSLLTQFIELFQKPAVRNDPVIKAMMKGVVPQSSPFESASMAVATLRNAGCLDNDKSNPTEVSISGTAKKVNSPKEKKEPSKEKPGKLRGFSRALDVLLEDAVFRGEVPDKEKHPIAIELRKLRAHPEKEYTLSHKKAIYDTSDLPNGKHRKVFRGLEKDETGSDIVSPDLIPTRVRDLPDLDLLAVASPQTLALVKDELENKVFSWKDKNIATPESPDKVWPSLKGTTTSEELLGLHKTKSQLLQALKNEKFAFYGPSPTLAYDAPLRVGGKGKELVLKK